MIKAIEERGARTLYYAWNRIQIRASKREGRTMKLRLRFSIFFAVGLLCFIIYMGLVIGLILEYIFPLLNLDNSGDNLISFLTVFLIPFMQTLITDIAKMPGAEKSELKITAPIAHVNLRADKKLIRRAFQNILVNAIYHNPPHTQIIVKINPPQDGTVNIEFRDNGTGVNKAIIDKISNNKPKPKNLHGLDIVKSIITAHNGNITIESKNKQGSHFHIQLPTEETTNQKNQS